MPEARSLLLWCNVCDARLVNPADPTTGIGYLVNGHKLKTSRVADKWHCSYGKYLTVAFSVCPECKLTDAVSPFDGNNP